VERTRSARRSPRRSANSPRIRIRMGCTEICYLPRVTGTLFGL
jgi:hypothetical protein